MIASRLVCQGKGQCGNNIGHNIGEVAIPSQWHDNWEHNDTFKLISYKHKSLKVFIDPRMQMIHVGQYWEKFVEELQNNSNNKIMKNDIMCKNKWSSLNFNFFKILIIIIIHGIIPIFGIYLLKKEKEVPFTLLI